MQVQTDGTVYADVLFLINFSMDFLCFYITARIRSRRMRLRRTAAAAAIGGVYSVAILFLEMPWIVYALLTVGVPVLMCAVAEGKKTDGARGLFLTAGVFVAVSTALGGIMTALYSVINESEIGKKLADGGAEGAEDDLSVWLLALLAAAGTAATLIGGSRWRMHAASHQGSVKVSFSGKSVTLRGMTDTGNFLTDPLSGRAVVLCELDAVEEIFPAELAGFWRRGGVSGAESLPTEMAAKLRFIPAVGAVGKHGSVLAAVMPDSVEIFPEKEDANEDGRNSEGLSDGIRADVLIAPVPHRLSAGGSRALFPPGIF